LHLDCVGSKSGIFRCVHGFDFGPSGFSFGFFTRALRPGPNSRRALGFLSFLFLPPLPKCAAVLLLRARVSSSSFRSAPPLGLGSSRQAVACAPPGCSPRVIRVLGFISACCVSPAWIFPQRPPPGSAPMDFPTARRHQPCSVFIVAEC
jgi:hypothetical protein